MRPTKLLRILPAFLIGSFLISSWWMSLAQANVIPTHIDNRAALNPSDSAAILCVNSITVTNTADSGVGSLRQALEDVCHSGIVDFDLTYPATVTLTSSELKITKSLSLNGPGVENLTVSGDDSFRVFNIRTAMTDVVTITSMTIANGNAITNGGGILLEGDGALNVQQATLINNYSDENGGSMFNNGQLTVANSVITSSRAAIDGGGVYNSGRATIDDTTIAFNVVDDDGGGIYTSGQMTVTGTTINSNNAGGDDGGGIHNSGEAIIENTAIVLNEVNDDGGGIYTTGQITVTNTTIGSNDAEGFYSDDGATSRLTHVTITESDEEGIYLSDDSGTLEMQNSLIVNNLIEDIDVSSSGDDTNIVSLGYNIVGSVFRVNFSTNTTGDLYGDNRNVTTPNPGATEVNGVIDGRLDAISQTGGSFYHIPQMWSPAVNHIPNG
ncbi:MAG: right-handed parallel beta-helix repeat-containing protein, partial [Chloroflexota bacterium]